MKGILSACAVMAIAGAANAQILVDFDGTQTGLVSFSNSAISGAADTSAFAHSDGQGASSTWGPGDAAWPMSREFVMATGTGVPFAISDDSVNAAAGNSVFSSDTQGFADTALGNNGFFGVVDTDNGSNPSGDITATWTFDISGLSNLAISIDFAAMGDFESSDTHTFDVSIDGNPAVTVFSSAIDDSGSQSYLMDSGATPSIIDPMLVNGVLLNDVFQTISAGIQGSGSQLTLTYSGNTNGGDEAFGFDNIEIVPTPGAVALFGVAGLAGLRRRRA